MRRWRRRGGLNGRGATGGLVTGKGRGMGIAECTSVDWNEADGLLPVYPCRLVLSPSRRPTSQGAAVPLSNYGIRRAYYWFRFISRYFPDQGRGLLELLLILDGAGLAVFSCKFASLV